MRSAAQCHPLFCHPPKPSSETQRGAPAERTDRASSRWLIFPIHGTSKPSPGSQWRPPQPGAPSLNCPQRHLPGKAVHTSPADQASATAGSDGSPLRASTKLKGVGAKAPCECLLLRAGFLSTQRTVGGPRAGLGVVQLQLCPWVPSPGESLRGTTPGSTSHLPSLEHLCPRGLSLGGHIFHPHGGKRKEAALSPRRRCKRCRLSCSCLTLTLPPAGAGSLSNAEKPTRGGSSLPGESFAEVPPGMSPGKASALCVS